MKILTRILATVVLLALVGFGLVFYLAGRATPPQVAINQPAQAMGAAGTLDASVQSPGALETFTIAIEQNGQQTMLFDMRQPGDATFNQESADRFRVVRRFGKPETGQLKSGAAKLVTRASRKVLFGLRTVESTGAHDVIVRLTPPRVALLSIHHFINHAGSEMVVYNATPPDVESGVRVGEIEYPGFPASGAGVSNADPSLRVAFFALLHDQDLNTPIQLFARDEAGNEVKSDFEHRMFPKPFRRSRIELNDTFLRRVVPAILEHAPELNETPASSDDIEGLLRQFLRINGELRQKNNEALRRLSEQTAPEILWNGAFKQLTNSAVESSFADHRTYFLNGKEVDQQVHLGFDLAVTTNVPLLAANRGKVLHADYLGIYGNCVVIDHGMGVQTLYGHLSSFAVAAGDMVEKDQTIGRSGMTGLAGGDHLHFTTLIHGRPVNPVDWWDQHWIDDRVTRKLKEIQGTPAPASTPTR